MSNWQAGITFYLESELDEDGHDVMIRSSLNNQPSEEMWNWISYPHPTEEKAVEVGAEKLEELYWAITDLGVDEIIRHRDNLITQNRAKYGTDYVEPK